jgi:hypothetical protein
MPQKEGREAGTLHGDGDIKASALSLLPLHRLCAPFFSDRRDHPIMRVFDADW